MFFIFIKFSFLSAVVEYCKCKIMVSKYKRKSNLQSWDETNMRKAMEKVQSREMSLADASRDYAVPKTTLYNRIKKGMGPQKGMGSTYFILLLKTPCNKCRIYEISAYILKSAPCCSTLPIHWTSRNELFNSWFSEGYWAFFIQRCNHI